MRDWQKQNPQWELCCDAGDTDRHYVQWGELPKAERMSWIGSYGRDAKAAFEEFGTKRCKTVKKVLTEDLKLVDVLDWPAGFNMLIFLKMDNA